MATIDQLLEELRRDVVDEAVLDAIRHVPRESFVPDYLADRAFENRPLPIGHGQTISQPLIVALMAAAATLSPTARVLEIGTGSGYAAAVLSELAAEVHTVERLADLADDAAIRLDSLGYATVTVHVADGSLGLASAAPYDAIVVSAGAPDVPQALVDQLAPDGRLVVPVGSHPSRQDLTVVLADGERLTLGAVRFVPLLGAKAWLSVGKGQLVPAPTSAPIA